MEQAPLPMYREAVCTYVNGGHPHDPEEFVLEFVGETPRGPNDVFKVDGLLRVQAISHALET